TRLSEPDLRAEGRGIIVASESPAEAAAREPRSDRPHRSAPTPAAAPAVERRAGPRSTQQPGAASPQARTRRAAGVPQGMAVAVRLALQAGPDGVALVARAQRMNREEEIKLRSAIDALLARHGLRAGNVTINGESRPSAGFEGG
ncbi:MAG: hypothetical protein QOI38_452, partial [Sphingomonadales bacterium]|nr:hypothetical protein [Sphingomonadales bacterium]